MSAANSSRADAPGVIGDEGAIVTHEDYYAQERREMLPFIPRDTRRLIDIGCGEGRFGGAVKEVLPHCDTWGLEAVPTVAARAAARNDRVIAGPFDHTAGLPDGHFDVVTMNDVLEHMPYPEPPLALARQILRPGGRLILSLPNVRYYLHVRDFLIKADWEYQDYGILDRTHLRFFTMRSARRLVEANGFRVETLVGLNASQMKPHYKLLFALAPRRFDDMRYFQMAVVAVRD